MLYKNKKSRNAIPGYSLIPKGDHHQVRKIGITGQRIKSDPVYKRTRLCAGEFAQAARLGRLIRMALLPGTGISSNAGPLTGELFRSLGADETTLIGDRDFSTAQFHNLIGFNLNPQVAWNDTVAMNITTDIIAAQKQVIITIPAFVPAHKIKPPGDMEITHFRIYTIAAAIDWQQQQIEKYRQRTTIIPLKEISVQRTKLIMKLTEMDHRIIVSAAGIQWYRQEKSTGKISPEKLAGPLNILELILANL